MKRTRTTTRKRKRTTTRNNEIRSLVLLVLVGVSCCSLEAQKNKKDDDANTRVVQGQVLNADDQPVVGAVVQLKDMHSLQIRSFVTQEEGKYHFSGLKTEIDYQVKAMFNGMSSASKTVSLFDTRKIAVLNLKLEKEKEKDKK
jgi:hypothetical protein